MINNYNDDDDDDQVESLFQSFPSYNNGNSIGTIDKVAESTIPNNNNLSMVQQEEETQRTSLLMELPDGIGVLHDVLRYFWKYDVNVTRIESRPSQLGKFDFFVDMEGKVGDSNIDHLLSSLKNFGVSKLLILDEKQGE